MVFPRIGSFVPTIHRWMLALGLALVSVLLVAMAHDARAAGHLWAAGSSKPVVVEAPLTGAIDPVTKDWVERVLKRGADESADAVVFTMDTPGGLQTSMDDIVKQILAERKRPVFVYVAPDGARAASAGAYIALSADVIGMAPSTNIGSATPINGNGKNIGSDLRRKVINDAVAKATVLAKTHDRNTVFAREMITKGANLRADEALDQNVIEFVSPSLANLLNAADGTTTPTKNLTINTKEASVIHLKMPWTLRVLQTIIDPNVLYLLFSAGLIGLAFEITHPGVILPGVAGATCLILALYGFQVLPTTGAGLALLGIGALFILAELFVPSHGVLGIGGAVCLVLGGLLLFDRDSAFAISRWEIAAIGIIFVLFFSVVVRKIVDARRQQPQTGRQVLIGELVPVRAALAPEGTVFAEGEIWRARTEDGSTIPAGNHVKVAAVDGLTLVVDPTPVDDPEHETSSSAQPEEHDT